MGDEIRTFKEKMLFYTTAFFILLGTFSMFAFLFLVPFVIEPAFTTIFMQFEEVPALCETYETETYYGARNCSWASCREGCTKDIYTCTQIRVNYRLNLYNFTDEFNFTEYHINLKEAERELPPVKRTDRYERALRDYEYDGIGESSSSTLTNTETISSSRSNKKNLPYSDAAISRSTISTLIGTSSSSSSIATPINNRNDQKNYLIDLKSNNVGSSSSTSTSTSSSHRSDSISNNYHINPDHVSRGGVDGGGGHNNAIIGKHKPPTTNAIDSNDGRNRNKNNFYQNDVIDNMNIEQINFGETDATNGFLIEDPDAETGVDMDDLSGVGTLINSERQPFDEISELNENLMDLNSTYFYVGARLFPNVKGCGYPPMLNCTIWLKRYTKIGAKFPCYYSKVDPSLVISDLDYWQNTLNLIYSMAIPIPSFIISVIYLTYAYFKIYNEDEETAPLDKNAEDMDVDEEGVDDSDGAALAENAAGSQVINMDSTTGDSCMDIVLPNGGPGMTKSISQGGASITTPGGQYLSQTTPGDSQMTPNSDINSFGHQLKVQMADDLSRDSLDNGVLSTSNSVQGNLSKTMTTSISTPPGPTAAV